jgi:hypothetical protein
MDTEHEKKRAYHAAWRAANADKVKAHRAAYRAANSQKQAAYEAAWRAANPGKQAAYQSVYRAANSEKINASKATYRAANAEKIKASAAAYYASNAERVKAYAAAYYAANRKKLAAYTATYYAANRKKRAAYAAAYRAANPEKFSVYAAAYRSAKYRTNPNFRIAATIRNHLHRIVKSGGVKDTASMAYVGCTAAQLRKHLERQFQPGMTWQNHGEWHIDHIIPLAAFDFAAFPAQIKQAEHYTNLRPIWAAENLSKSDTLLHPVQLELIAV